MAKKETAKKDESKKDTKKNLKKDEAKKANPQKEAKKVTKKPSSIIRRSGVYVALMAGFLIAALIAGQNWLTLYTPRDYTIFTNSLYWSVSALALLVIGFSVGRKLE